MIGKYLPHTLQEHFIQDDAELPHKFLLHHFP